MKKNLLIIGVAFLTLGLNAQNLITNGSFENDGVLVDQAGTEWGMWSDNGGTAEVIDGVCVVTPGAASENNWAMQVEQKNFTLENDVTYEVKFKARAEADRVIALTIEDPANGYGLLGVTPDTDGEFDAENEVYKSKWNINITTTDSVYTRTVTIKNVVENTIVKFGFLLSTTADVVYLDDVSMTVKDTTVVPTNVASVKNNSMKLFPNPAVAGEIVKVKGNTGAINVFDIAGKLVVSSESSNISGLVKGLYFVKSGNQVQKLVVK